jgi:peptidoglycan/LPS O-acetylase OafA/YrhL
MSGVESSFGAYRSRGYIPALDGIRAVAVGMVILAHSPGQGLLHYLCGWNGVTIFFVLSGYLITTLGLREERRAGAFDFRSFLIRRLFRIMPLYALILGVYCALVLVAGVRADRGQHFAAALPYYLSPIPEIPHFLHPHVPFEISWSVGIEEKFYLAWPLIALVALRRRPNLRLTVCIAGGFAAWAIGAFVSDGALVLPYAGIFIGCALALCLDRERMHRAVGRLASGRLLGLIALCALCAALAMTWLPTPTQIVFPLLVAAALGGLVCSPWAQRGLLASRPFRLTGRISYALYLTHQLGLGFVTILVGERLGTAGDVVVITVGTATAYAVSYLLHTLVEAPLIAVGKRVANGPASGSMPVSVRPAIEASR